MSTLSICNWIRDVIAGALLLVTFALLAFQPGVAAAPGLLLAALGSVSLWMAMRSRRFWLAVALVLVCAWRALSWGELQLQNRLASDLESVDLRLKGYVVGLPASVPGLRGETAQRFDFRVQQAHSMDGRVLPGFPGRVRLSAYGKQPLAGGEGRHLVVRLKQPRGFANPGGFDYELWLFNRGIGASGYVRSVETRFAAEAPLAYLSRLRFELRSHFAERLTDPRQLGIAVALSLGDKSLMAPADAEQIRSAGLSHLMAISGLHIGLAAAIGLFLGRAVGALLSLLLPVQVYGPRVAVYFALSVAAGFAVLSGFAVPAQRALIMLGVWAASHLSARYISSWNTWWLAVVAVLWLQPLALQEAGFWLSFTAVAVLIFLAQQGGRQSTGWFAGLVRVQIVLCLLMAAVQWKLGLGISFHALWINLLAIPFVSLLVVPAVLLALVCALVAPALAGFPLLLVSKLGGVFWWSLDRVQPLADSGYLLPLSVPSTVSTILLCLLLALALLPVAVPLRGLAMLTVLLLILKTLTPARDTRLTILDVGQGLAVVAESEGQTLLYDTGARFSANFNAGDAVILPFLQSRSVKRLQTLVISHDDNDHLGGYAALEGRLPVEYTLWGERGDMEVEDSGDTGATGNAAGVPRDTCDKDRHWKLGRFEVYVLGLGEVDPSWESNDRSCVVLLEIDGYRVLLPGDIERQRELLLLSHPLLQKPVDLMLAPHHGSKTSSSRAWVSQLQPALVVFSAGYRNRYRHPHHSVSGRYRAAGSRLLCTSATGAVILDFNAEQPRLRNWREAAARYWRFREAPDCDAGLSH